MSMSMPRSAGTAAVPWPKVLVTPRTLMAGPAPGSLEDNRGLQSQDADQAQEAAAADAEQDGDEGADQQLPGEVGRELGAGALAHDAEGAGRADADAEGDGADDEGLHEDHGQERAPAGAHGLEDGEVAEDVQRELVEHGRGDDQADDEPEEDGDAEVDADAGLPHDEADGFEPHLVGGEGGEVGEGVDRGLDLPDVVAVLDADEDVGHGVPPEGDEVD